MPNETSRQETMGGLLGNLKARLAVVERRPHPMHYANFSYATVPSDADLPPADQAPPGSWYIDLANNLLWENTTGVWVSHPVPASGSEWPGGGGGGGGIPTTRRIDTQAPLQGGGDFSVDRIHSILTFGAAQRGVVPASGGGTTTFLRADGTWVAPPGGDEVFIGPADPGGAYDLWFDTDANAGAGQLYARVGGAWVPASAAGGAGVDEVIIQPTDPGTANTYELWVDSDANPVPPATGAGTLVGEIKMWAGAVTPPMYLPCDGALRSRTTYAALFAAIGTTWGAGDGSTTFAMPDMRGVAPVGAGQGTGLTNRVLGTKFGAETVALATGNLPAHSHPINVYTSNDLQDHSHGGTTGAADRSLDHLHIANIFVGPPATNFVPQAAAGVGGTTTVNQITGAADRSIDHLHGFNTGGASARHNHAINSNTDNTGSGTAVANVQPSVAVNYIIFSGVA